MTQRLVRVRLLPPGSNALLEALDECEQFVTLPHTAPLAFVQPIEHADVFEPLKGPSDSRMRLPGEALGRRDFDHRMLRQHADELPDGCIPAGLTKPVEPG